MYLKFKSYKIGKQYYVVKVYAFIIYIYYSCLQVLSYQYNPFFHTGYNARYILQTKYSSASVKLYIRIYILYTLCTTQHLNKKYKIQK